MHPELTISMVLVWLIVLVATWTLCVTPALPRRRPENRRTHRLAGLLSISKTLWRGPKAWVEVDGIVRPSSSLQAVRHPARASLPNE